MTGTDLLPRVTPPLFQSLYCQGCGTSAAQQADQAAAGATPSDMGDGGGAAAAAMLGGGGLFSPVELSISAEGLAETDALSAPDPLAVVYENTKSGLIEVGRTEVICTCKGVLVGVYPIVALRARGFCACVPDTSWLGLTPLCGHDAWRDCVHVC